MKTRARAKINVIKIYNLGPVIRGQIKSGPSRNKNMKMEKMGNGHDQSSSRRFSFKITSL